MCLKNFWTYCLFGNLSALAVPPEGGPRVSPLVPEGGNGGSASHDSDASPPNGGWFPHKSIGDAAHTPKRSLKRTTAAMMHHQSRLPISGMGFEV
ncbi:hypothetical protein Krac_11146 [Ktedonobacter racemifer DSM 44963]|uniref:Uncharacterized protein n=1 Tax=Ktedonobacter racemifer DSM 44963 TaxID=485913 RepID=D6TJH4_KTERA|nr:hypothetical protein Krac_11146 [Ktedonobacter racemifer DSM 44963]